ncbi:N-formylglutamate amidohydrolase [Jejuia pallidilutea]|uniref:N-formylglutamate amidohydrolase n=1 Tax=Jejuia pallidilutea TaxID=504487 RepID=A0A098LW09_9FLAO|nr:N-formylglutamate amidohydrolase [Jejuia pallidilutea]GAL91085.1 hypothetical protein JCM19538_2699 [Jejuia pallidilutea]
MKLILTCEHAGNKIPEFYKHYFKPGENVLKTHRGIDLGAFDVFKALEPISDWAFYNNKSRLLIELNRSQHHPQLFSEFTRQFSKEEKEKLINLYYLPYRNAVKKAINIYVNQKETVLHVSVHSFTPQLNGVTRNCDIGLLFDSRLQKEKTVAIAFKEKIKALHPNLNVRFNYPYLGKADGFTTFLRKEFPQYYLGLELEINQNFVKNNLTAKNIKHTLHSALKKLLATKH